MSDIVKPNGKNLLTFITVLVTIGVALLAINVKLMYSLSAKVDQINNTFVKHELDYVQHKTSVEKDIQALQKKE